MVDVRKVEQTQLYYQAREIRKTVGTPLALLLIASACVKWWLGAYDLPVPRLLPFFTNNGWISPYWIVILMTLPVGVPFLISAIVMAMERKYITWVDQLSEWAWAQLCTHIVLEPFITRIQILSNIPYSIFWSVYVIFYFAIPLGASFIKWFVTRRKRDESTIQDS